MYNLQKLTIKYQTIGDFRLDKDFDKEMEELANKWGLGFVGSGYNYQSEVRDLEFDNDIFKNKNLKN